MKFGHSRHRQGSPGGKPQGYVQHGLHVHAANLPWATTLKTAFIVAILCLPRYEFAHETSQDGSKQAVPSSRQALDDDVLILPPRQLQYRRASSTMDLPTLRPTLCFWFAAVDTESKALCQDRCSQKRSYDVAGHVSEREGRDLKPTSGDCSHMITLELS